SQVFFEPPQRPWTVGSQTEDILPDLCRLVPHPMWFGKEVGIEQAHEVCKTVVVAVVWSRRQKEDMVGIVGQAFGHLIALGFLRLIAPSSGMFGVGTTFVRLINNDEVPPLVPDALTHVILLGVVE